MNKIKFVAAIAIVAATPAFAGTTASSNASTQAQSAAANMGNNQSTTFEGSHYPTTTHNYGTPMIYTAPSAFGFSQDNCAGSDTMTVGTPFGGIGGSKAKPMFDCNVRQDTRVLWQLGLHKAAMLRMVCFGSDAVRMSYEASGGVCPASGTAKGIPGAPVGPKFAIAQVVPQTMRGTIQPDGSVKWSK
jgi:hypothetical protein